MQKIFKREKRAEPEEKKKKEVQEDTELKDLERQIRELGRIFEEGEEAKPKKSFLRRIGLFQRKDESKRVEKAEKKAAEPAEKEKKSRLSAKFDTLIDKSHNYLDAGNIRKAKKLYTKTMKVFASLSNEEKKDAHSKLVKLYNKLSKTTSH